MAKTPGTKAPAAKRPATTAKRSGRQRRSTERLEKARELVDSILEQMPAGILIAEAPSGRVIRVNKRLADILRQPIPRDADVAALAARHRVVEEHPWPIERTLRDGELVAGEVMTITRGDGTRAVVSVTSSPIRENRGRRVFAALATFTDVTDEMAERARAGEEDRVLAETGTLLEDMLDPPRTLERAIHTVVPKVADWSILDMAEPDGSVRQAAAAHVDPDKERFARDLARSHPPDPSLDHGVAHVMRTGRSEIYPDVNDLNWVSEALGAMHPRFLRELGARSYMCVPLRARGAVFGALTLVRGEQGSRFDARDLRLAEELGRRVALAIDNGRLYQNAEAAVRARDEFFAVASHELKSPITTLLLQTQSLRLATPGIPETVSTKLQRMELQVLRLDRLVNSLLDITRITAGKMELEPEEVDLMQVAAEEMARHADEAARAGSRLSLLGAATAVGQWDRMRVEQVAGNLLSNAIKYGAGKPIDVSVEADATHARLIVRDHGIGIAAGALERIFEPFERAAATKGYGGVGMGLYITRQIVVAHGGTIDVSSEVGVGSTFTVDLPLRRG